MTHGTPVDIDKWRDFEIFRLNVARNNCEIKAIKMSRAHMLYDNKPLESVPVTPVRWEKRWEPEQVFRLQRLVV